MKIHLLLLAGFFGVLLLGGVAVPLYRNEGLRALLAYEALHSGQWLVPRLYGEPHLTKPPGMGVAIALCSWPFGNVTPLTSRIPSILAGLSLIAMIGAVFSRRFGTHGGLVAAALTPCSVLWLDRVPSAEIDLVQAAWVAGSLLCLLHAAEGRRAWWLAAILCVAGGFFTKWTAPAFFYLTAIPWLWHRRQLHLLWSPAHLACVALFSLLAGGWLVMAVSVAGWRGFFDTLAREALMRLSPAHHPRPYPWEELATFPLSFVLGCLPLALLVPLAVRPLPEDDPGRALVTLAWAWLISSLIFWTLVPGHRPRHILPAQPAIAILAAYGWLMWGASWRRPALAALLILWLGVKITHVGWVMPTRKCDPSAGRELARLVPPGEMLHLVGIKDENLLFTYGRPARRAVEMSGYCLVMGNGEGHRVLARLRDSQGAALALVDATPPPTPSEAERGGRKNIAFCGGGLRPEPAGRRDSVGRPVPTPLK